tara:strand:- start:158 stop:379 length:222 start_codon:yes stop_codon:yes gene_type:complete
MFNFIFLQFYKYKEVLKKNKNLKFSKTNLYKWMNLTKNERFDLTETESKNYLKKRKTLLKEIRKEYKNIAKNQ